LRDDVVPLADTVKNACAESGFVERDRFTRSLDPQLGLDTRHRLPSLDHLTIFVQGGGQPATSHLVSLGEVGGAD